MHRAPRTFGPRATDRAARHVLFSLCIALPLAWLGPIAPALAQAASTQAEATPRILALEDLGRARPNEAAAELERLLAATQEHGAQRLELLTVQGLIHAIASQPDAARRCAARLEAWGRDSGAALAPGAAAAALLIRARSMARGGNLQRADALTQEALARLPDTMPARDRHRFVSTRAYIASESGKLEDAVRVGHESLALADRTDDPWR